MLPFRGSQAICAGQPKVYWTVDTSMGDHVNAHRLECSLHTSHQVALQVGSQKLDKYTLSTDQCYVKYSPKLEQARATLM